MCRPHKGSHCFTQFLVLHNRVLHRTLPLHPHRLHNRVLHRTLPLHPHRLRKGMLHRALPLHPHRLRKGTLHRALPPHPHRLHEGMLHCALPLHPYRLRKGSHCFPQLLVLHNKDFTPHPAHSSSQERHKLIPVFVYMHIKVLKLWSAHLIC